MVGVDIQTIQELDGWRTLAMVQRYAHLAEGHLRAAVERLARGVEVGLKLESKTEAPAVATVRVG
jgi:hypothetical protein